MRDKKMGLESMVTVVDYGMGNDGSIRNMLNYLGYECYITSRQDDIAEAANIILPGVGHFKRAMMNIKKSELDKALEYAVYEKKAYVLGICLGMQLLMDNSEEGACDGLGYIHGKVVKFRNIDLPVPHMGWNTVEYKKQAQSIYALDESRYYFVHSYYVCCSNQDDIMASTEYGIRFTSAVQKGNITGVQFHPEKSHIYGMHFLRRYMETTQCTAIE